MARARSVRDSALRVRPLASTRPSLAAVTVYPLLCAALSPGTVRAVGGLDQTLPRPALFGAGVSGGSGGLARAFRARAGPAGPWRAWSTEDCCRAWSGRSAPHSLRGVADGVLDVPISQVSGGATSELLRILPRGVYRDVRRPAFFDHRLTDLLFLVVVPGRRPTRSETSPAL